MCDQESARVVAAISASASLRTSPGSKFPKRLVGTSSDPAGGRGAAIFRASVEGDGRSRRGTVDGVDHRFEDTQPAGWQADTRANHHAVVYAVGQATFNHRDSGLVGLDEAVLGVPAPPGDI